MTTGLLRRAYAPAAQREDEGLQAAPAAADALARTLRRLDSRLQRWRTFLLQLQRGGAVRAVDAVRRASRMKVEGKLDWDADEEAVQ